MDVSLVVKCPFVTSSFTYVIVDTTNSTRTCINTPVVQDLTNEEVQHVDVSRFEHIHFDSRNTFAALTIAQAAAAANLFMSIDAEKDRPHLEELLCLVECIFTNQRFPRTYTGW